MRIFGKNPLKRKLGTVLTDPLSCLNFFSFERNVVPLWWITENRPIFLCGKLYILNIHIFKKRNEKNISRDIWFGID